MTYIFGGFLHGHDRLLHNPYWVNNQAANTPITPNRAHPPTKRGMFSGLVIKERLEFIGEIIGQVYATESDGSDTDHGIFYYTLDQSSLSYSLS
jgi:hypothetical protein